jgi:hypothetical protein
MKMNGRQEIGRRELLRRTAVAAGTAVWTVPVIKTVMATPAYAQSQVSPVTNHSTCVAACQVAFHDADCQGQGGGPGGNPCQRLCDQLCPNPTEGGLDGRPCINCAGAADPNTFSVATDCTVSACGFTS